MPRCGTCSSFAVIDGSAPVFTHHLNVRALASSAALGCELCQFLYEQLEEQLSKQPESSSLASLMADRTIDSTIRFYRTRDAVSPNELRVQVGSDKKNRILLLICSRDGECCAIPS